MPNFNIEMRHTKIVIKEISKSLESLGLLEAIGNEIANEARNNAYFKPGRKFWREVGDSVSMQKNRNSVVVGATHAAAGHKQFGGDISAPGRSPFALGAKALTIPVGNARLNRWNVDDAKTKYNIFKAKDCLFGVMKHGRQKNKTPELLFILKKKVHQEADPWFPDGEQLERAVAQGIRDYGTISGLS